MVTLLDVAQAAGVSKMTASNALNGKPNVSERTRKRILAIAEQLDYHPNMAARTLSSGRNGIIEVVTHDLDSPFYAKLAWALSEAARQAGLRAIVQQTSYSEERERAALDLENSLFCDALVIITPILPSAEILRLAQRRPLMVVNDCSPHPVAPTINSPNASGMKAAMSHLLDQGRTRPKVFGTSPIARRIALHSGAWNPTTAGDATDNAINNMDYLIAQRIAGAQQALSAHGMKLTDADCIDAHWNPADSRAALTTAIDAMRRGRENTGEIPDCGSRTGSGSDHKSHADGRTTSSRDDAPFDALLCLSDTAALGAMQALADAGLSIPSDVAVIGFDGITLGTAVTPPLSTVEIDVVSMAATIITRLKTTLDSPAQSLTDAIPRIETAPYRLRLTTSSES